MPHAQATYSNTTYLYLLGPYVTTIGQTTHYNPEMAAPLSGGGLLELSSTSRLPDDRCAEFPTTRQQHL